MVLRYATEDIFNDKTKTEKPLKSLSLFVKKKHENAKEEMKLYFECHCMTNQHQLVQSNIAKTFDDNHLLGSQIAAIFKSLLQNNLNNKKTRFG